MILRIALILFATQAVAAGTADQARPIATEPELASISRLIDKPLYESIFSRQMSSGAILDQVQEAMFV